jgi:hypothetical protein
MSEPKDMTAEEVMQLLQMQAIASRHFESSMAIILAVSGPTTLIALMGGYVGSLLVSLATEADTKEDVLKDVDNLTEALRKSVERSWEFKGTHGTEPSNKKNDKFN